MADPHHQPKCSVLIPAISIITYNQNNTYNTKYIGQLLEYLTYFILEQVTCGITPNGSLPYLYMSNWHAKVVRYDHFFNLVSGYDILS